MQNRGNRLETANSVLYKIDSLLLNFNNFVVGAYLQQ